MSVLFLGSVSDAMSRLGERRCVEENRRWLRSLKPLLAEKFDGLGFNVVAINSHTEGVKCFSTSRKYPNLYTTFEISEGRVDNSIIWEFYINSYKQVSFEIPLFQLLYMLGILDVGGRRGLFGRRKSPRQLFTPDMFWKLAVSAMESAGLKLVPYRFRYEDTDGIVAVDLPKDTDWFLKTMERRYIVMGELVVSPILDDTPPVRSVATEHVLRADPIQMRLLDMFRNDKVLTLPANQTQKQRI